MLSTRKVELGFFFVLVAAATALSFFILKPYLGALFVALVFAVVFKPLYVGIHGNIQGATLASSLTLLILLLGILVPAGLFGFFLFDDAQRLYSLGGSSIPVLDRLDNAVAPFEHAVSKVIPGFEIRVSEYVAAAVSFLVDNFGSVFSRAVRVLFQTFIMLFALFYLFRDGKSLRSYVVALSPLANEYDERILKRLESAISSVVKGKLLIVFIQGILAALACFIFSLPHAVLWGALTMLAALIPAVGVAVVFVPLLVYLFMAGSVGAAVGLLVSGVLIGLVDNVLGPVLYEKGLRMHPLLILLSVLGGLVFFGPVGFLAGPVTLSLFFALVDIYPLLFQGAGNHQ